MAIQRSVDEFHDQILIYKNSPNKSDEWKDEESASRIEEETWIHRYKYESGLISGICKDIKSKKILEFGPGPGKLADMIQNEIEYDMSYTMIDNPYAKKLFEKNKFKGKFLVKDLMNYLDTSDLDNDYDFLIANDFLEHIANPSNLLSESYKITTDNAKFFISVPNWRMGHSFIYRGLFDYDNIIYTMKIHGWEPIECYESFHQISSESLIPKLSSEDEMPDELLSSWNWYFLCDKIL